MGDGYIINRGSIEDPRRLPVFEYAGYDWGIGLTTFWLKDRGIVDGARKWRIDFNTDGTFTPTYDITCDVAVIYYVTDTVAKNSRRPVQLKAGIPVEVQPRYKSNGPAPHFGDISFPSQLASYKDGFLCLITSE